MLSVFVPGTEAPCLKRAVPRPFMKWVGGKGQLIQQIWPTLPEQFGSYHEPFMGGAALYFALKPSYATLSDVNAELVDAYRAVKEDVEGVIGALKTHKYEQEHYYRMRQVRPSDLPLAERAARTIFLNKTGFNGLYRVNRKGEFNVPFGRYTDPQICHEENLRACSSLLQSVQLVHRDFERVLETARPGDLVYFDPPYVPLSHTAAFTSYIPGGFGAEEHLRLADVFTRLAERGVHVLLSNSDTAFVRQLYRDFEIEVVSANRNINAKGDARGPVHEVLVRSYPRRTPTRPA